MEGVEISIENHLAALREGLETIGKAEQRD